MWFFSMRMRYFIVFIHARFFPEDLIHVDDINSCYSGRGGEMGFSFSSQMGNLIFFSAFFTVQLSECRKIYE